MSAGIFQEAQRLKAYGASDEPLEKEHAGVTVFYAFGAVEGFKAYVVTVRVCTI